MAATGNDRHHRGYWDEFRAAVEAMEPRDLLVWEMSKRDARSTGNRRVDLHTDSFVTVANWFDGRLFIVRVK